MPRYKLLNFFFIFLNIWISHCLEEDYCWRDYTGTIPDDAVVGGQDINGNNFYIGQAYLRNAGILVTQIFPGVKEVQVPFRGAKKISANIKILCGLQQNFYWSPANSTHLHLQLIGKHPVIGGVEVYGERDGVLNVGRLSHEGELKIGKVRSSLTEKANFHFTHKGNELTSNSYEILLYETFNFDVRSKPVTRS